MIDIVGIDRSIVIIGDKILPTGSTKTDNAEVTAASAKAIPNAVNVLNIVPDTAVQKSDSEKSAKNSSNALAGDGKIISIPTITDNKYQISKTTPIPITG